MGNETVPINGYSVPEKMYSSQDILSIPDTDDVKVLAKWLKETMLRGSRAERNNYINIEQSLETLDIGLLQTTPLYAEATGYVAAIGGGNIVWDSTTFGDIILDEGDFLTSNSATISCPLTGAYEVTVTARFDGTGAAGNYRWVLIDGTVYTAVDPSPVGFATSIQATKRLFKTAGDTFVCAAQHDAGIAVATQCELDLRFVIG